MHAVVVLFCPLLSFALLCCGEVGVCFCVDGGGGDGGDGV
jgi:hypothetical protein